MRWIVRVGVALAVVVVLAFGLLATVPSDRIAQAVSGQFEAMTGRKLEVLGEIKPRLWPSLGVTTGPVSIANAEWVESDQPLLRAEGLSIDVNLGALDAPDQLVPTYELWTVRREAWLPPFPLSRRYARDRDATGRLEE